MPRHTFVALLCALSFDFAAAAGAEDLWAVGAPLDLRSGASTGYRVVANIAPGEKLELLQRGDGWVRVRTAAGKEGWVVDAHVDATAPPRERVGELEAEATRLRTELAGLTADHERLRANTGELEGRDAERSAELDRLLRENARLSAGERGADWLTGAGIVLAGMALGALLRSFAGPKRAKIRL